jgi:molecular chaperone GrpE
VTSSEPSSEEDSPTRSAGATSGEAEPADPEEVAEADGGAQVETEDQAAALLDERVAELTEDLQRVQAEYVNYRKRVDRDRELVRENATYAALAPIVDVLDDIDRAKDSAQQAGGELDPGFKAVADKLERIVTSVGLTKFGQPGEAFDPTVHEALSHLGTEPGVEVTTVKLIAKAGYRIGDRVVRAAQVLVVDPE